MMLEATYKAIKRKIISRGLLPTVRLVVNHVMNICVHRESLFYYVDIQSYSILPNRIGKGIVGKEIKRFDEISADDICVIREYAGEEYIRESKQRLDNNWSLFLAYIDSNLAGAVWAFTSNSVFKTKVVPILDGDAALEDGWTLEQFRGRSVYPFLLSFIINHYKSKNYKRAYGSVHEKNIISNKGVTKAGLKYILNYEIYKLFGNEIVIWKSKSKKKVDFNVNRL